MTLTFRVQTIGEDGAAMLPKAFVPIPQDVADSLNVFSLALALDSGVRVATDFRVGSSSVWGGEVMT